VEGIMKGLYRVGKSPMILYYSNLMDFSGKEALMEMLGFCDPVNAEAQCRRTERTEKIPSFMEGEECSTLSESFSPPRHPDVSQVLEMTEQW
jgi:hypothetical protein